MLTIYQETKYHQILIIKLLTIAIFGISLFLWPFNQIKGQGNYPPPAQVIIDSIANSVTWRQPGDILFREDFESASFPPQGWESSSAGKGWIKSGTEPFLTWIVPGDDTRYALVNDDSAAVQNDGSLDMLVSPVISLITADSCRLSFRSFYTGAYGQDATIKYRLYPAGPWFELGKPIADKDWRYFTFDLSEFSGAGGTENFQLAYHADDKGYHASGWAVDNFEISGKSTSGNPSDYLLFWDGQKIDSTTGFSFTFPFNYYGENHQFGICSRYPVGNSDTIFYEFESRYLPPPANLEAQLYSPDHFLTNWDKPYHIPECYMGDLQFVFEPQSVDQEGGCETDGEFIYVCYQNSNRIDRYNLEGNLLDTFHIQGIPGLYDLAYNPENHQMYGGHGDTIIYIMDFNYELLLDQMAAPVEIRGLAFDPEYNIFWANNLSSDFTAFSSYGQVIYSFPVGDIGNYYGLACDATSDGYMLWGFSRDSTGRLLVQYDVNAMEMTGVIIDVSPYSINNGLASGLFIQKNLTGNCVTLGGNLQNDIVFGYTLYEEMPPEWNPPGVDHYCLYNQDTLIYTGDDISFWYNNRDNIPNTYALEVSALYNLEVFGFPGEYAESDRNGPLLVPDLYGFSPDFIETWNSETFSENQWDTIGVHWKCHASLGNPSPSAAFYGVYPQGPYDETLTSQWINTGVADSCNVSLIFDYRILDSTPTGMQTLTIECCNLFNQDWREIKAYHNDSIISGYVTDSILLNPYLLSDGIKIRFHLYGNNSEDVAFWIFDNIRIFRTCSPPIILKAEMMEEGESIMVSWQNPYEADQKRLQWGDGINFTTVGFNAGPETWYDIAARWDTTAISVFNNYEITSLAFIPAMTEASYIMKIWKGDSARTLLYEKVMNDLVPDEWAFVAVDPPIPVDITKELWIGYSCSSRGGNPFSVDQGPAVDGYGNMIRSDGSEWTGLLSIDPSMNYNFNIRAQLVKQAGHTEAFQVYRSIGNGPFQHIATTGDTAVLLPSESSSEEQCFKARLICFNHPEMIIVSDFSGIDCALPVQIPEPKDKDAIRIFPNPTDGEISLQSSFEIQQVELYNNQGILLRAFTLQACQHQIDLKSYGQGIYLLRIKTSRGYEYRKIVLMR